MPETAPPRRGWCLLSGIAGISGLPIALAFAFGALKIFGAAASDCQAYEAGDRFALLFLYFPVLSVILWLAFFVPTTFIGRRSLPIGALVGLALVLAIAYAVAASAPETIRQSGDLEACPGFVPDWWPWFLRR